MQLVDYKQVTKLILIYKHVAFVTDFLRYMLVVAFRINSLRAS